MRKYRILFSIPVHEKPEVVLDQINNFLHFNPDCCIVLHISSGFRFDSDHISEDGFFSALGDIDRVYVNPNRLRSGLEDIIQCHISNFCLLHNRITQWGCGQNLGPDRSQERRFWKCIHMSKE